MNPEEAKAGAAKASLVKRYEGCWVHGNQWVKLGLSREQARLLKQASRRLLKPQARNNATAAWYLLNVALSHLEIMERLMHADLRAAKAEGDCLPEMYWDKKSAARRAQAN